MKSFVAIGSALALASLVEAQQPEYAQCGGIGYTGSTTCVSPYVCTELNPYYYQCLVGTTTTTGTTTSSKTTTTTTSSKTTTTTTTSKTTTTTTTTTSSKTTTTSSKTTTSTSPVGTGFVSTVSSPSPHFELDGKPFYFGGTNAYYLPQLDTTADMVSVFETMNSLGLTVVRVWMFNEVSTTQNYGAYYHLWNGTTATFNLGPNGFDRMDETLALAEQYGVKVLLTLTNNWNNYGGSDVYVTQLGYTHHDDFYTQPAVISAFKTYVDFVIGRYGDNSTVFGWELMNEPRCGGSSSSVPASSNCTSATVTAWVNELSTYIHSIDSNHIVGVGDEGFFCWTNTTDYIYDCGTGGDSNSYSKLSGVDFLTFHMYPEGWGETSPNITAWGELWIEQHAYVQQASGKPAILEEFGIGEGDSTKVSVYGAWYDTVEEYKLGGVMYWQLGNDDTEVIDYTQSDANTIFCPDDTETCPVVSANAAYMASLNT